MKTVVPFLIFASCLLLSSCDYLANTQKDGLFAQGNKTVEMKRISVIDPNVGVEAMTLLLPKGWKYKFNTYWDSKTPNVNKEFRAVSDDGAEFFAIYPNISFFNFSEHNCTIDDIIQEIILPNYKNIADAKVVLKGVMPFDVSQL